MLCFSDAFFMQVLEGGLRGHAFTLKDGFTYVEQAIERGLDVDTFAPRLSFFFGIGMNFFMEVAKLRAARLLWAETLREKYGAVGADWESGAIAWTAARNEVPCLILRAGSDLVGAAGGEPEAETEFRVVFKQ